MDKRRRFKWRNEQRLESWDHRAALIALLHPNVYKAMLNFRRDVAWPVAYMQNVFTDINAGSYTGFRHQLLQEAVCRYDKEMQRENSIRTTTGDQP